MKRTINITVTYQSEQFDDNDVPSKKELRDEENKVIEYIRELIELDFHETYKLKIKKYL